MGKREQNTGFGFTYIALGLVVGFFMGSGIVYWYSNRQNDSIFSRNLWDYFARLFEETQEPETFQVAENRSSSQGQKNKQTSPSDTIQGDTTLVGELTDPLQGDSLADDPLDGSAETGNLAQSSVDGDLQEEYPVYDDTLAFFIEDIHLARDSLLGIRAYSLPSRKEETPRDPALRQLDSLLGNVPRQDRQENTMIVEFWLSPLNYHGYKMSHNKIIVYGMDQLESFSLHSDGNSYFIKYHEDFYPLSLTMDFKPLIPTVDPGLME